MAASLHLYSSQQKTIKVLLQHPTAARQNWPGLLSVGKHAQLLLKLCHNSPRRIFKGCEWTSGDTAVTHATGGCIKSRAIIPLIPSAPSGPHHICQPHHLENTVPSNLRFCYIFTKMCKLVPTAANIFNVVKRITCIFTW